MVFGCSKVTGVTLAVSKSVFGWRQVVSGWESQIQGIKVKGLTSDWGQVLFGTY